MSSSWDQTIKIWNSTSFKLIGTLSGHTGIIYCLASLSNSNIVSGGLDGTIKIWETKFTSLIKQPDLIGHKESINDLKFLNNGDLASCSSDNSIMIWDMNTFSIKSNNAAHNRSCLSLSLLNNDLLISSSEDKSIKSFSSGILVANKI